MAAAIIGGALFHFFALPLPWLLGPLAAVLALAALGYEPRWSRSIRDGGTVVLGAMMGAWFTPDTIRQVVVHLPGMLLVTGMSVLFGVGAAYLTSRRTGISLASGMLGSTPGGLSQMVILCDEFADANLGVVSMLQTMRLLAVIFVVPFLAIHIVAGGVVEPVSVGGLTGEMSFNRLTSLYIICAVFGAVVANKLSFPTPFLLGPLLGIAMLGIAGVSLPRTPLIISAAAQLCMGVYMGIGIDISSLRRQKSLLLYALLGGFIVIFSSLLGAWLLTWLYPVDMKTAFLSAAPGGIAEMGLTAAMIDADVSMVTTYQIFRLLFIIVVTPLIFRRWLRKS